MGAHFQWQSTSIYDALEPDSSGNILYHISQWLMGEIVYGSYHPQAVTEGGGTQVPKALLISCRAEGLAVWARNYQVDSCQLDNASCINLSDILRDLIKQSVRLNDHFEGWGKAVRVAVDKLLKRCQRNLSGSGVFIAKVELCNEAAARHEGSNDVHACATA